MADGSITLETLNTTTQANLDVIAATGRGALRIGNNLEQFQRLTGVALDDFRSQDPAAAGRGSGS